LLVRTERARVSRWEQGLLGYPNCSPEFIATADPHGSVSMAGSYAKSTSGKVLSLLFYLAYTLSRVHQGGVRPQRSLASPSSRSRHAIQESGKARGCCAGESPAGPRSAPLSGSRGPLRLGAGAGRRQHVNR
jgi:hypothetical protein